MQVDVFITPDVNDYTHVDNQEIYTTRGYQKARRLSLSNQNPLRYIYKIIEQFLNIIFQGYITN